MSATIARDFDCCIDGHDLDGLLALAETVGVPAVRAPRGLAIVVTAPDGCLYRIWEDDNVLAIAACDSIGYPTGADELKLTNGNPELAVAIVRTVVGI